MKKTLFILGVLGILGAFVLVVYIPVLLFKKQAPPALQPVASPTPITVSSQTQTTLSPLEKVVLGTPEQTIAKLPNLIYHSSSTSGITTFEFLGAYKYAPTVIQTLAGRTIFIRTSTYTTQPGGFPSFKALSSPLGKVEEIIQTNITYGDSASAYIFASKGFCFIVNDNTDEVYEIMRFIPMSLSQFKQNYAAFIAPAPPDRNEGIN